MTSVSALINTKDERGRKLVDGCLRMATELRAQSGLSSHLAPSRILFKGCVRPLSVEDDSPQHPLNSKQKRFTASAVSRLSTFPTIITTSRSPLSPVIIYSRGP